MKHEDKCYRNDTDNFFLHVAHSLSKYPDYLKSDEKVMDFYIRICDKLMGQTFAKTNFRMFLNIADSSFQVVSEKMYEKMQARVNESYDYRIEEQDNFTHMSATHKLLSVLLIQLGYDVKSEVKLNSMMVDIYIPEHDLVIDILGPVHFLNDGETELVNSKSNRDLLRRHGFKTTEVKGSLAKKLFLAAVPMDEDENSQGHYIKE